MVYLEQVNNSMNELHKSLKPAQNGIENIIVKTMQIPNIFDIYFIRLVGLKLRMQLTTSVGQPD